MDKLDSFRRDACKQQIAGVLSERQDCCRLKRRQLSTPATVSNNAVLESNDGAYAIALHSAVSETHTLASKLTARG